MAPVDLVTGATGLLGNNLVRVLASRGRMVRALVRSRRRAELLSGVADVEFVTGDVTDQRCLETAMRGVEDVYHCAARVTTERRITHATWDTNVRGTDNVLGAARRVGVRRVVHCSSVDALGLPEDGRPATEDTPWNWDRLGVANAYARSKRAAHQIARDAARRGQDVVIVCPTYMFGEYDFRPSSGRMILACATSRLLPEVPGGNNFVDVLDVAEGMLAAASEASTGEVYVLGNANLLYAEILDMIAAAVGRRPRRVAVPRPLALLAGLGGDVLEVATGHEAPLNLAVVRLAYVDHYYDVGKAKARLGLPQRPVYGAIERAVKWFRQAGML